MGSRAMSFGLTLLTCLFSVGVNAISLEIHTSNTLLNDAFRMEAIDRGLTAKLAQEEAKAILERNRQIHEQNLRAGNAVSRFERSLSRARLLESEIKVGEHEISSQIASADEHIWDLRLQQSRGATVPLAQLAGAHAAYWENRRKLAQLCLESARVFLAFTSTEIRVAEQLLFNRAISRHEFIEMQAYHRQAEAQFKYANERLNAAERFWKETLAAQTWAADKEKGNLRR